MKQITDMILRMILMVFLGGTETRGHFVDVTESPATGRRLTLALVTGGALSSEEEHGGHSDKVERGVQEKRH